MEHLRAAEAVILPVQGSEQRRQKQCGEAVNMSTALLKSWGKQSGALAPQ